MIEFTEGSRMRTNASGSPKTEKPNIIPKGQMTNQIPCNHRTPYKPQVEYYDEQIVIVNGVQYQKIEEPKPPTLYNTLYVRSSMSSSVCDTVCEIVKKWLPDEVEVDTEEYNAGWNACIKYLKENLK
jgi:hypothetical protein